MQEKHLTVNYLFEISRVWVPYCKTSFLIYSSGVCLKDAKKFDKKSSLIRRYAKTQKNFTTNATVNHEYKDDFNA